MARYDPSSEKENQVPRAHRSETGSGGLGSARTRGLMNNEHRLQTVLKESSLQNQAPVPVTSSKTSLGSTEKEWLKNVSSDYLGGKQSAGSLERLKEKIGQLRSVGAVKTHKSTSAFDQRGLSPNVSEPAVHVYWDDQVSKLGDAQKETLKAESQRRNRETNSRNISQPIHEQNPVEQDVDDSRKSISPLSPTKSSAGKDDGLSMQKYESLFARGNPYKGKLPGSDSIDTSRRAVQTNVDSGGDFVCENQSVSSSLVETKSVVVQDLEGKYSLVGESLRNTSPREGEAKSSRENSAERLVLPSSALVDKIIKRSKLSNFGPALRVRRDDPRAYTKAESPSSEKAIGDGHQSPEAHQASKMADSHVNISTNPKILEAGTLSSGKSNQRINQNTLLQTDDCLFSEHRKRKAETDPSTTDTYILTGVGKDRQISNADAMVSHDGCNTGGNLGQREREGCPGSSEKDTRAGPTVLEQSDERWTEEATGHPLTSSCTKGTPGHERESRAWKTARDTRASTLPSPASHDHSKSGKVIGGIPPRYVPPSLEPREQKLEENVSPASDGLKHISSVLKQMSETEKSEHNSGAIPHSNLHVKGLACADDNVVNHLTNTFSTISIEEKIAAGSTGADKASPQGNQIHVSGHHVHFVTGESGSNTGVTGVTAISGVTSPSDLIPHKTKATSSHAIEQQHRPDNQQPPKDGDRAANMPDRNALPKSTCRSTGAAAAEVSLHGGIEGQYAKASDPSKERGEKNQEISHHKPQPQRKMRAETETDKFVHVNGIRYQKLGKIGKGGSSEVFKVIATDCSIYALKRINLKGRDWSTAQEFYQEIKYLKALRGKPHIIQLIDSEVTNKKVLERRSESGDIMEEAFIYMVLEYGEIDLAGILSAKRKEMQRKNGTNFNENWLRFYWEQILEAVRTIHDERIVHSDLKPANFMLVRGELKLIDFGIAKAIQNDTTSIVKENQTGTMNYMSPEAFLQSQTDEDGSEIKIGRASDIWSLGCIFYQMVYGQTPFAELSFYSKIQAITNPHHRIHYPPVSNPHLSDMIKECLKWDRRKRLRIPELLVHPFLRPHIAPIEPEWASCP